MNNGLTNKIFIGGINVVLWNRVQTVHGVAASEWHNKAAFKYKQNLHTVNNDTVHCTVSRVV